MKTPIKTTITALIVAAMVNLSTPGFAGCKKFIDRDCDEVGPGPNGGVIVAPTKLCYDCWTGRVCREVYTDDTWKIAVCAEINEEGVTSTKAQTYECHWSVTISCPLGQDHVVSKTATHNGDTVGDFSIPCVGPCNVGG